MTTDIRELLRIRKEKEEKQRISALARSILDKKEENTEIKKGGKTVYCKLDLQKIDKMMMEKGLTLNDALKNRDTSCLYWIKNGKRKMVMPDTAKRLADAFNVNVDDIVIGKYYNLPINGQYEFVPIKETEEKTNDKESIDENETANLFDDKKDNEKKEFRFTVKKEIGVISQSNYGRMKSLTITSWYDGPDKYDIRCWEKGYSSPIKSKGVSFSRKELIKLRDILNGIDLSKTEMSPTAKKWKKFFDICKVQYSYMGEAFGFEDVFALFNLTESRASGCDNGETPLYFIVLSDVEKSRDLSAEMKYVYEVGVNTYKFYIVDKFPKANELWDIQRELTDGLHQQYELQVCSFATIDCDCYFAFPVILKSGNFGLIGADYIEQSNEIATELAYRIAGEEQ